jgi:hypothetical protein
MCKLVIWLIADNDVVGWTIADVDCCDAIVELITDELVVVAAYPLAANILCGPINAPYALNECFNNPIQ